MKAVKLECPYCGAPLDGKIRANSTVCNYCKMKVILENDSNDGTDAVLIENIHQMIEPISNLEEYQTKIKTLSYDLYELESKKSEYISTKMRSREYLIPFGILLIALLMRRFPLIVIGLFLAIGVYYSFSTKRKNTLAVICSSIQNTRENIDNFKAAIDDIYNNYDIESLPEDYRTKEAVTYIYNLLADKKAINIAQAITIYDKEKEIEFLKLDKIRQEERHRSEINELKEQQMQSENGNYNNHTRSKHKRVANISSRDINKSAAAMGTLTKVALKMGRKALDSLDKE